MTSHIHQPGDPFYRDALKFIEFMGRMPRPSSPPSGSRDGSLVTLVTPWHGTVVPFYNILLGARAALEGYRVTFLWDDLIWYDPENTSRQNQAIGEVLALAAPYGTVDRVGRHAPMPMDERERRELERLAELNAIWKFRDPERTGAFEEYRRICLANFIANYPRSKAALAAAGSAAAVVPGGIVGSSGLFMTAGRGMGMRMAAFDSDPGEVVVGVDDVAAHLFDLAKVMERPEFKARPEDLPWIRAEAEAFFGERIQGKDHYQFQVVGLKETVARDDLDVLMPLNVMWDSAALGRHAVFEGSLQWVLESVGWMLENTSARIVVRQHPSERIWQKLFNYRNPMEQRLQERFGLGDRLRYIRADEERNTYEMLAQAKLVISATSTVGLEALLLGVPVVTDCRQYFASLPGVTVARSREEYFAGIRAALSAPRSLDAAIPPEAWTLYFFSQRCNACRTRITPLPQDYEEWIRWEPARMLADEAYRNVCTALFEGVPAAYLNYRTLAAQAGPRKA